jgi:N-acetylneuraminic acid mutarotase
LPYGRKTHTSVVANGYIYLIGGADASNVATSSIIYAKLNADGSTGSWITNATSIPVAVQTHSSVVANGYVYVIGGAVTAGTTQTSVYYAKLNTDGSVGAWSTNTNVLPTSVAEHSSVAANGYVYVVGGSDNVGPPWNTYGTYYAKLNGDGTVGPWQTSKQN